MNGDVGTVETADTANAGEKVMHEGSVAYRALPPAGKASFQIEKIRTHLDLGGGRVNVDNETGTNNGEVKGLFGMGGFDYSLLAPVISSDGNSSTESLVIKNSGSKNHRRDVKDEKFEVISEFDRDRRVFTPSRVLHARNGASTFNSDTSVARLTQLCTRIVGSIHPHG